MEEQPNQTILSVKKADETVIYEEKWQPCFVWTLILAPCLMPVVWKYHVRITSSQLSFGYSAGCAQCNVDRSQVRTVEVIPKISGLCDWGGYGIRKQLPSWDTGYIATDGPGVRMTMVDENGKELCYTFSSRDPERVVSILTGEAS